ncbi:MAG: transposon-encoded TnpW family protein [Defluviitaleaceae bacterium]|nr:transposon-encoded TnpW family protein [Defluviitaleaceae bacterium]
MTDGKQDKQATEHKIGKITYIVEAGFSETAKDGLKKKIENLIIKDLKQNFVDLFDCQKEVV